MKPFDLEAAKRGEPVCTADGREVRLYAFDSPVACGDSRLPIVGVMNFDGAHWGVTSWREDGLCTVSSNREDDLRMVPRKETRWLVSWTGKYGDIHAEGHDMKLEAEQAYQRLVASTSAFKNVTITEVEVEL